LRGVTAIFIVIIAPWHNRINFYGRYYQIISIAQTYTKLDYGMEAVILRVKMVACCIVNAVYPKGSQ